MHRAATSVYAETLMLASDSVEVRETKLQMIAYSKALLKAGLVVRCFDVSIMCVWATTFTNWYSKGYHSLYYQKTHEDRRGVWSAEVGTVCRVGRVNSILSLE